jgi:predicted nucleotidyltransferase
MSLDFSLKPELRPLAELVRSLRSVADPTGVQFLLIGAAARDLMLRHAFSIPATRQTMDVDFGVAVADWAAFELLRRALIDGGQFREDKGVAFHRFYHAASGLPVDVVPFGGIERTDRTIVWPSAQNKIFDCFGMREALTASVFVLLPGGVLVSVASIPALTILKVTAWVDRKDAYPGRDATDLLLFLSNYMDCDNFDRVVEQQADLLDDPVFDYETAGARLLARDVARLLDKDGIQRVLSVVRPESNPEGALLLVRQSQMAIDRARRLIRHSVKNWRWPSRSRRDEWLKRRGHRPSTRAPNRNRSAEPGRTLKSSRGSATLDRGHAE